MKITELQVYERLEKLFEDKGYSLGVENKVPIYSWENVCHIPYNLSVGHYIYAHSYGKINFVNIPAKYRTREFFLHSLSGVRDEVVEYVKTHPTEFDRQFFKDHIATNYYSLEFEVNDFEFMPLEYIDEEMVVCAMFKSIDMRYIERRGDCDDWFYSVYKRKPEVLTEDMYILGARCFATKRWGKNRFLEITPEEYRTAEYYFALCLNNDTPVMEDIPESILTPDFLARLLNDTPENIKCFSEQALEKEVQMVGKGLVRFWQAAIILNGYQIKNIPLNEQRVEYFLSIYDKDSFEYEYGFKEHYKRYLREKSSIPEPSSDEIKLAGMMTLAGAMLGMEDDSAVDLGNCVMNRTIDRNTRLPIHYSDRVPAKYSKKYDREEYLLEIYKKLGIQVVQEVDYYYYSAILPNNIFIVRDDYGYCVKNSQGDCLIHYYDRGPFYDRSVNVDEINVIL